LLPIVYFPIYCSHCHINRIISAAFNERLPCSNKDAEALFTFDKVIAENAEQWKLWSYEKLPFDIISTQRYIFTQLGEMYLLRKQSLKLHFSLAFQKYNSLL
jgi:hypothetical protein